MAIVAWLLEALPAFLRTLAPSALKELARKLGTKFSTSGAAEVVEPTIAAIMTKVRAWCAENPKAAFVILSLAVDAGMEVSQTLLDSFVKGTPEGSFPREVVSGINEVLSQQRQKYTGDGSPDTNYGGSGGRSGLTTHQRDDVRKLIESAAANIGSFELLMELRTVMFIEDDEFESYRRSME